MNERIVGDGLAIDPGLNNPAACAIRAGRIIAATRVKTDKDWIDLDRGDRVQRVASEIIRWAIALDLEPRWVCYEWPQVYRATKSLGDPNDLVPLAAIGAAVAGQLAIALAARDIGLTIITPTPAEWIGQLSKKKTGDPWESPRGQFIRRRLDELEFDAITPNHDSIDAAGLGLYACGRLERIRVFPGAT